MNAVVAYWQMLAGKRMLAALGVLLLGLGGTLEAIALLMLLPVFESVAGADGSAQLGSAMVDFFDGGERRLLAALSLFAVAGAFSSICKLGAEACILKVRNRVELDSGIGMANALLDVGWEPFATLRQGDIAKALLLEGNQMAFGVRQYLTGIGAALTALPLIVSAALVSPSMTGYTLVFGGVAAVVFFVAARPVRRHVARLSESISAISIRIADTFGNLKFFRSTGLVAEARKEAQRAYQKYAEAYFDSQIYPAALRHGVEIAALAFISFFLYWQLAIAQNSPASVLVFLAVFYRLVPKVVAAQDFLFQAATYTPWFDAWQKRKLFCDSHRQGKSGVLAPDFGAGLIFEQVSFSFRGSAPVLQSVDLAVPAGHCMAIVGVSGSGKTTLLDLVTGLLRPDKGRLLLGGRSLHEIDIERWQQRIGFVPQDCPVFFASILENIAWGDTAPDRQRAEVCARQAHAWDFIDQLPDGLDSLLGERGCNLSGGQRQRLGIARALYRQPWLLILDEATSALDSFSEQAVQAALAELKGHVTMLLVAHRLQTVAMADEIIVLDRGAIVERGSWNELMAQQGAFHGLVHRKSGESQ